MNNIKIYKEYCTGCGLCKSVKNVEFEKSERGFLIPKLEKCNNSIEEFCENVCPVGGKSILDMDTTQVWGRYKAVYLGYATDEDVRFKASSGGIITATAIYLLESGKVDGIIHTGVSQHSPIETQTYCSTTREQLISLCGSRYATSSPLMNITDYINSSKTYAFIGKPCDIVALRNYMKLNPEVEKHILYCLSFFCAGVPSEKANRKLVSELGCSIEKCSSLNYRGNGWPGYTTAIDSDQNEYSLDYNTSWWKILGRDVGKICRFCLDGIGESADISCGDAWYLTEDKKPSFSEHSGRNIVFARTDKGLQIIKEVENHENIKLDKYNEDINDLFHMQTYQYDRKTTMYSKLCAMKFLLRPTPFYNMKILKKYSRHASYKRNIKVFAGTIKRYLKGKL